jgi:uncharacterized RDD family membrane protein YckC
MSLSPLPSSGGQEYATPFQVAATKVRIIPGFWARVLALLVDEVILGAVLTIPGVAASHFLSTHPLVTLLVGSVVAIPYFTILNSRIGKGQTFGKKALGIRVTDRGGELIPVSRSGLRAVVFLIPFIFGNTGLHCRSGLCSLWTSLAAILAGFEFATFYLYVFNRRTRQTVHDLVAGTFVIQASAWPMPASLPGTTAAGVDAARDARSIVTTESVWRPHFVILAIVFLVAWSGGRLVEKKLKSTDLFVEVTPIHTALLNQPEVRDAGVMKEYSFTGGRTSIVVTIQPGAGFGDDEAEATKMAGITLDANASASNEATLTVVIQHNVNFGIWHYSWTRSYSHTPEEWRAILLTHAPLKAT